MQGNLKGITARQGSNYKGQHYLCVSSCDWAGETGILAIYR